MPPLKHFYGQNNYHYFIEMPRASHNSHRMPRADEERETAAHFGPCFHLLDKIHLP
jgi:hypothetical protein